MLHPVLDAAGDSIIVVDWSLKVIDFNPAAERLFGYRQDEVLGKPVHEILCRPGTAERIAASHAKLFESEFRWQEYACRTVEDIAVHKDGTLLSVEVSLSTYADGFIAIIRDTTARRKLAQNLSVAAANLAFAAESLSSHQQVRYANSSNPRILIVDDNLTFADSVATILRLEGYEVCCANNGLAGIQTAKTFVPDLVVLDIGLPDIDGFEVCKSVRATVPGVRVVAITGLPDSQEHADGKCFDACIAKPVEPNRLCNVISKFSRP